MKKSLLLISALALFVASCTNEEPIVSEQQTPEYAAANSYLNINLRNPSGSPAKRADVQNPYEQNDGTYEDGTGMESKITHVRFYFFNEGGAPFGVRQDVVNNLFDNYVDWFPNSTEFGDPNHTETVEQTLNATVGLTFTDEEERPAQVVAVANPTTDLLSFVSETQIPTISPSSMSLQDLQKRVNNYLPADDETPFIMSNSVYVDASGDPVYATALEPENFQPTPALAAENVVKIYIERVVARVDFGIDMPSVTLQGVDGVYYSLGEYDLNDGADGSGALTEEEIYVKFLGWNVTSTTATSYLIKDINPGWSEYLILGDDEPWYISQLHRSFWAINPNNVQMNFGNFGTATGDNLPTVTPTGQFATSLDIPTGTNYTVTYLQENANPYSTAKTAAEPTAPSKVIIAAQLVNSQGQPMTIGQYQNVNYTLQGLKNQLAKQLGTLYYKTTVDGEDGWAQIDANMLTFDTTDPAGNLDVDKEYNVFAVLTQAAQSNTWATSNDGKTFTQFTAQDGGESVTTMVNKYIRSKLTSIMIWNSGLTYYFFDIQHLGIDDEQIGYLGIVRNHIYRTKVTGVAGLGTPVYNPDLVIHPEKTESEETIIKFVIEPLSWRLVMSSYDLNWE